MGIDARAWHITATARRDVASGVEDRSAGGIQRELVSCGGLRIDDDLKVVPGDLDRALPSVLRDRKCDGAASEDLLDAAEAPTVFVAVAVNGTSGIRVETPG